MKEYRTKTFGQLNAERYDAMYEDLMGAETRDSVETLAELARGGKVLELAIGTGRVALPLAARGLAVHGIEASEAMVAKLREKPGGSAIPVVILSFTHRRREDEKGSTSPQDRGGGAIRAREQLRQDGRRPCEPESRRVERSRVRLGQYKGAGPVVR